jgi:hypothetical protein
MASYPWCDHIVPLVSSKSSTFRWHRTHGATACCPRWAAKGLGSPAKLTLPGAVSFTFLGSRRWLLSLGHIPSGRAAHRPPDQQRWPQGPPDHLGKYKALAGERPGGKYMTMVRPYPDLVKVAP